MSMTGFGKAAAEAGAKKITVEIKSLNSKQMDLSVRLPFTFREHELDLRSAVARSLERGKADVTVSIETVGSSTEIHSSLDVNAMAAYKHQIEETSAALGIDTPSDWYSVLLRFPDVIATATPETADSAQIAALDSAVSNALAALAAHRRAEGAELEVFFAARIETIGALLDSIEPFEAERVPNIRRKIEESLAKINLPEYDKGRLEQEMIFYIEKLDVNEEKQRLRRHLQYFMETMNAPAAGQGKKLGFIAQEMGREINTLGSKSNNAEMQAIVVRMKDALEQIKEQVLNVL